MGMIITKTIHFPANIPFKTLLYFEKNPQLSALQNYFETIEYSKLKLLNVNQDAVDAQYKIR